MSTTISAMCMCCNSRLSLTGDPGPALDADLAKMHAERGWLELPPRAYPKRPHPVNVCAACWAEISAAPKAEVAP